MTFATNCLVCWTREDIVQTIAKFLPKIWILVDVHGIPRYGALNHLLKRASVGSPAYAGSRHPLSFSVSRPHAGST